MDIIIFYKELYFHEIDRKFKLDQALTLPIGLNTIIGGAIYVFISELNLVYSDIIKNLFDIFLLLAIFAWLITIYYLIRSRFVNSYAYLPAEKINQYHNDLVYWNNSKDTNLKLSDAEIDKNIDDFMCDILVVCVKRNFSNNNLKSGFLHQATNTIVYNLIFLFLLVALRYIIKI